MLEKKYCGILFNFLAARVKDHQRPLTALNTVHDTLVHDRVGRLNARWKKVLVDVTAGHETLAVLALNSLEHLVRLVDLVVGHLVCKYTQAKKSVQFFGNDWIIWFVTSYLLRNILKNGDNV